ncbi:cytochrome P450 [Apodospora peruviana]|uniref:Cytochrome P450 n=1 Tax=Apodospora peruviana TaxID=516989 RepID=A0AAE0IBE0_9PEZI|nr:cytochrome P450 [Apodospora peruviana]
MPNMTLDSVLVWRRLSNLAFQDSSSSWQNMNGRPATAALIVLLPFLITYLITLFKASWVIYYGHKPGACPPTAPYAVPLVDNTIQFASDPHGYIAKMLKYFRGLPFRLRVGTDTMYYLPHGEMLKAFLKNSQETTSKPSTIFAMRDVFGLSAADLEIMIHDDSGSATKPASGYEDMDPRHRYFYTAHRLTATLLSGTALDAMTALFVANFTKRLRTTGEVSEESWTEIPDLYRFLRDHMFRSSIDAFYGDHLFRLFPDFANLFWTFDKSAITIFLRRIPRWMAPKAYRHRDKIIAAVQAWGEHAQKHYDYEDQDLAKAEWEPLWGSRLVRARDIAFRNNGYSPAGAAAHELGLMWAINANAVPATFWALYGTINTDPSSNLVFRVLAETEAVSTTTARNPISAAGLRVGDWTITEQNAIVLSMSWFGANDATLWNNHNHRHPVNSFWAERFLEYPDDPFSGPLAAKTGTNTAQKESKKKCDEKPKTAEDDKTATLVTSGIQNHFYPYGGGSKICPGRFFAKQEIITAVATMLSEFEIDLLPTEKKVGFNMSYFAAGTMPPDRTVPARIRRRRR